MQRRGAAETMGNEWTRLRVPSLVNPTELPESTSGTILPTRLSTLAKGADVGSY